MSLKPLYNIDVELVAWLDTNTQYIFDIHMDWIAFIYKNNIFSSNTRQWLGVLNELTCLDRAGRPILWTPNTRIERSIRPVKPLRPLKPKNTFVKPKRPKRPNGGWSKLSFYQWINQ